MKNVFIAFLICASINPLYAQEEIHCPSDGVVKIDSETNELICCKDGWAYQWYNEEKKLERYMYAELCGCPDGGYSQFLDSGQYACCKKGYYLTRNGYSEWDSWGTCKCQGSVLCYLRQFKDRLMRRIKGENECCA